MSVMYVLVPAALVVVLAAVIAYLWAAHRGQFDDLTTPAYRALHDDPGDARLAKRARAGAPPVAPNPADSPPSAEGRP